MGIDASAAASDTRNDNLAADLAHLRTALALARRGLGNVWPNPAVGCVIVNEGRVVGRGWTQPGGRPHAEPEALRRAGGAARGATAYISLEPCCHWGKTPPCTDALIAAGVARVVAAVEDPNPEVAGGGVARLREAGIAVETGLCGAEAAELNAGFFNRLRLGRPLVTLKLATTLDGRIATRTGDSRWITGRAARERAHLLRAAHDAVLVGTETVLSDDPLLTCRLSGLEGRSPVRVVLDRRLRLPLSAKLFTDPETAPVWVATAASPDQAKVARLQERGIAIIEVPGHPEGLDLSALLVRLGERGVTRLLVEGGGRLAAALLRADLVDRLVWMHGAALVGGDGLPAIASLGLDRLADAPRFERVGADIVGDDMAALFRRRPPEAENAS